MGKAITNIRAKYNLFSRTEKRIADFLLEKPDGLLSMYITDLARECGASEATIVRFARKLGYDGYPSLKIELAKEAEARPVNKNISRDDTPIDIFSKVCEDIYCSLEKTKSAISPKALDECCSHIMKAEKILVLGLGNSSSVANDASHKMFRLGLNAHPYTDNHMQAIATAHTDERSVVIGISHSGASRDILDAMQTAKSQGAFTVAITNYERSPINKVSDVVLNTVSDETNYRILGLSSRIAALAIIDTIYSYLASHLDDAKDKIARTEAALEIKKT